MRRVRANGKFALIYNIIIDIVLMYLVMSFTVDIYNQLKQSKKLPNNILCNKQNLTTQNTANTTNTTNTNNTSNITNSEVIKSSIDSCFDKFSNNYHFRDGYGEACVNDDTQESVFKQNDKLIDHVQHRIDRINNLLASPHLEQHILKMKTNGVLLDLFDLKYIGLYSIRFFAESDLATIFNNKCFIVLTLQTEYSIAEYPFISNQLFVEFINIQLRFKSRLYLSYISNYKDCPMVHIQAKFEARVITTILKKN